jgi:hypothetical protein
LAPRSVIALSSPSLVGYRAAIAPPRRTVRSPLFSRAKLSWRTKGAAAATGITGATPLSTPVSVTAVSSTSVEGTSAGAALSIAASCGIASDGAGDGCEHAVKSANPLHARAAIDRVIAAKGDRVSGANQAPDRASSKRRLVDELRAIQANMERHLFELFPVSESIRATLMPRLRSDPESYVASSTDTPLTNGLLQKTNAGVITFIAGCTLIAARRLESLADTSRLHMLAEVLLCFEADPKSYSGYRRPATTALPSLAERTVSAVFKRGTAVFQQTPGQHSSFPPLQPANNLVTLLRAMMAGEHESFFESFVSRSIERLQRYAANPAQVLATRSTFASDEAWNEVRARNFGAPVPLEVLDATRELRDDELPELFARFRDRASRSENPYLASR